MNLILGVKIQIVDIPVVAELGKDFKFCFRERPDNAALFQTVYQQLRG
jgi:hypothetical protein